MNAPAPRRPRPPKRPETLVELVLDLEERSPGEPDAAIELPAQEWAHLVARAQQEQAIGYRPALSRFDELRNELAKTLGWGALNGAEELLQVVRGYVMALDEEREANDWPTSLALESEALAAVGDAARKEMVKALGIGVDTEWADVVQITQGYVMAHHVEQQLLIDARLGLPPELPETAQEEPVAIERVDQVDDSQLTHDDEEEEPTEGTEWGRAGDPPPPKSTKREKLIPWDNAWDSALLSERARTLGLTDLYRRMLGHTPQERRPAYKEAHELFLAGKLGPAPEPKKKRGTKGSPKPPSPAGEAAPTMVDSLEQALAEASHRRLNGAGWKRHAKKAREENSPVVCHHCGTGDSDDGIARYRNDDVLPDGTFCRGCRQRLVENPREWDRHSVEGKPKPTRPTKKFPLAAGPTERCTNCGRTQGAHDGTRCPPQAHGDHPDDQVTLDEAIEEPRGKPAEVEGSSGGEGTEVYCRSCKAFFPAGTHTHAVAAKGRKQKALAELGGQ